jgi:hypothetical protein
LTVDIPQPQQPMQPASVQPPSVQPAMASNIVHMNIRYPGTAARGAASSDPVTDYQEADGMTVRGGSGGVLP